jgi:hypothetical protein
MHDQRRPQADAQRPGDEGEGGRDHEDAQFPMRRHRAQAGEHAADRRTGPRLRLGTGRQRGQQQRRRQDQPGVEAEQHQHRHEDGQQSGRPAAQKPRQTQRGVDQRGRRLAPVAIGRQRRHARLHRRFGLGLGQRQPDRGDRQAGQWRTQRPGGEQRAQADDSAEQEGTDQHRARIALVEKPPAERGTEQHRAVLQRLHVGRRVAEQFDGHPDQREVPDLGAELDQHQRAPQCRRRPVRQGCEKPQDDAPATGQERTRPVTAPAS